jgi:multidrug efflux pump subunit AcrB
MVLAIGLLVDDAIVVVENVERLIQEEGLSPLEAARKSMDEISGALIAIAVVLAAVFLPMAFFGGSTGVIYRQFSLTLVAAMILSVLVALILTPALAATILTPGDPLKHDGNGPFDRFFRWFNDRFERARVVHEKGVRKTIGGTKRSALVYLAIVAVMALVFWRLPTGFLPVEDQGYVLVDVQLPAGAALPRAREVMQRINAIFVTNPAVYNVFIIVGSSFTGTGENAARAFVRLKPWDQRRQTAQQFIQWANRTLAHEIHDARAYVLNLPTVRGLGAFGGFDFYLEDRAGLGRQALEQAQGTMLAQAAHDPSLAGVRANLLPPSPQLQLSVDRVQAQSMGLSTTIYTALQLMLAPVYE